MQTPRFALAVSLTIALVLSVGSVAGQNYPSKPIRIVTAEAGGGLDFTARLIASGISGPLGQSVVTDNRTPIVAAESVANASPDGYTLLLPGTSFFTAPLLQKLSYDPVRDFLPISLLAKQPHILVVYPGVPAKSVKELIALAKAKPGELNYASSVTGGTPHLAAELFKAMADVDITRINYKGNGAALNDLISGQVQLTFVPMSAVAAHIKSGRLIALGVTTLAPTALAPGLPTLAATVPGYEAVTEYCIFAPAKTPGAIINRLNEEIVRLFRTAEVKERVFSSGADVVASTPEELAATIKFQMTRLGKVIKDAGIRLE